MESFDTAIIGTSPGALMEALILARSGRKVCMVDRNPSPGGAWAVLDSFNLPNIESGPHFFQSHIDLSFLEGDIPFKLMPVPRTQWMLSIRGFAFKASDRLAKLTVSALQIAHCFLKRKRSGFRNVSDDRISKFSGAWSKLVYHMFHFRESTRYFQGGCGEFVQGLHEAASKEGITIFNDSLVSVDTTKEQLRLDCESGRVIECNRLLLTGRSTLGQVNGEPQECLSVHRNQVHLLVKTPHPLEWYLHRFYGLGYFAVVNLTKIGNHEDGNHTSLIAATLSDMSEPKILDQEKAKSVFEDLVAKKLLPKEAELLEYQASTWDDSRLHYDAYEKLQQTSSGRVTLVGNIDLALWIQDIEKRWVPCN